MAIEIEKVGNLYKAKILDSASGSVVWESYSLKTESSLVNILRSKNIDQREIQEAFISAAPNYFGVGKW